MTRFLRFLGLAFALVNDERYQQVAERLRNAGFGPDQGDERNPTRQRWQIVDPPATVELLVEPDQSTESQAVTMGFVQQKPTECKR